ncbi:MAG: methionyl-tRNA formyltransferase [Actinomycetes bacterium]
MRIVFAGTPDVGIPVLESIHPSVVGVLTRPDAQVGRGREVQPSPIGQWAQDHEIDTFKATKTSPELVSWLQEKSFDIGVVVAYGALLPRELLSIPKYGWINIHFSLLPQLRGAAPVQRAILNGDTLTGITIFQLEEGMDTGPIFGASTREIGARETSDVLLSALALESIPLLEQVLHGIDGGTMRAHPQVPEGESYAPKISKDEYRILWDRPSHFITRQVRAFHPMTYTQFRGDRLAILQACEADINVDISPGQYVMDAGRLIVGTAFGAIELKEVRPAGKKDMTTEEWLRGARLVEGERFE